MRNVLLIGDDSAAFAAALADDGFVVAHRLPGAGDTPPAECDVVVIDLASAAEDPAARHWLEAAQRGDSPPVIAIVSREQLANLDPARDLEDFLVSTAPAQELCARVRQAIWKRHRVDSRNVLKCGDLVMDFAGYTVHVAGRPVELTFKEYELLRFLATNRDRVFTREALLNKVWGYDFYGGGRTVDVHIRRLRAKIEDRHHAFIETVRNVGYRFRVIS
ncbi:MAG: response regulator transcription factor [Dehalococcoidia bacterium]|nr:response regulator transcription factor [Dehalococcoidia bacterium]